MRRLLFLLLLCVATTAGAQRGPQRRAVYRNPKSAPMVPCGVQNPCPAHEDSVKQKAKREDYEMILAQLTDCLRDLSHAKVNLGREGLMNYPSYGPQLDTVTTLAITQRNTCYERRKQIPDTTEAPPPIQPKPGVGPHSTKRIPVKKP